MKYLALMQFWYEFSFASISIIEYKIKAVFLDGKEIGFIFFNIRPDFSWT